MITILDWEKEAQVTFRSVHHRLNSKHYSVRVVGTCSQDVCQSDLALVLNILGLSTE